MSTFDALISAPDGLTIDPAELRGGPPCSWATYQAARVLPPVEYPAAPDVPAPTSTIDLVYYLDGPAAVDGPPSLYPPPGEWYGRSVDDLTAAVLLSWGCDAPAPPHKLRDDEGPVGWLGDFFAEVPGDVWGSQLGRIRRGRIVADSSTARGDNVYTLSEVADAAKQAIAWLVADGVASTVTVEAERSGGLVSLTVEVGRYLGVADVPLQFADLWEALSAAA